MKNKIFKVITVLVIAGLAGCTKLHENLNSTLTNTQTAGALGPNGVQLLLQAAYSDMASAFTPQDNGIISLEDVTADDAVVPTRAGDWDDNGNWRVLHQHTWNADHTFILNIFNNLSRLNFDATNVLNFSPSASQAAQATFLRAFALYYLLDLYGQYPIRNPGDNLLDAPNVYFGVAAADTIINQLTTVIPDLPTSGGPNVATQDAGNTLLMKLYLNRGLYANRATPTFDNGDMQKVISLGNDIINSGHFSYEANYFNNFSPKNQNASESIFAFPFTAGSGLTSYPYGAIGIRWMMTLHYNSWDAQAPNAGWNGFSTVADFYNSFGYPTATTATNEANRVNGYFTGVSSANNKDTSIDGRIGGRYYAGATNISGVKPGWLIGQQIDEKGNNIKDRQGHPLAFDPVLSSDLKENGANLEVIGIRGVKYVPDYSLGGTSYNGQFSGNNSLQLLRYPDVVLMVAEAKLRSGTDATGALALVNGLRAARGAKPMASPLTLLDNGSYSNITSSVDNPNCLLAERGREFWWEGSRRTDLERYGVYLKPWQYKTSDDAKNLLFPIPTQSLSANPNLKQNDGY